MRQRKRRVYTGSHVGTSPWISSSLPTSACITGAQGTVAQQPGDACPRVTYSDTALKQTPTVFPSWTGVRLVKEERMIAEETKALVHRWHMDLFQAGNLAATADP